MTHAILLSSRKKMSRFILSAIYFEKKKKKRDFLLWRAYIASINQYTHPRPPRALGFLTSKSASLPSKGMSRSRIMEKRGQVWCD
jgi:hypothetical protein